IMLLTLYWSSQRLTDGFLGWYQDLGFALTLMRSDDPDDRYLGLEEMVNPLREEYWGDQDLHGQIAILVADDPDPRVQGMACYVAGRLNVVKSADAMVDVFRESDDEDVRAEAAMALGRLEWSQSLAYLASRLRQKDIGEAETLGVLRGLAMMEDERGGSAVS